MNPRFAEIAEDFEARVRAAPITPSTEVTLVYHCVDASGNVLPPVRASLVPQTTLASFGEADEEFAATIHRDTILANINSLVRHAPEGLIVLRGAPQLPLRIVGFDLEIGSGSLPRIRLLSEDSFGGSLLVRYDLLEQVRAVLDRSGASYWVDQNVISVGGGPAMAVINLRRGSNARQIQAMLENAV